MIFLSILREDSDRATTSVNRWQGRLSSLAGAKPRSLIAQAMLYDMLGEMLGAAAGTLRLDHETSGRPFLRDESGHLQPLPCVSIAHSSGWLGVAATSCGDIGLDLEVARPDRDVAALAAAAFGPSERNSVSRDGVPAFYRIWSMREAQAKALGIGFPWVTDRQDHVPSSLEAGLQTTMIDGIRWSWLVDKPLEGLYLAIALRHKGIKASNHSTMLIRTCHVSSESALGSFMPIAP
jgi:phosphopantetheinyl transferase